MPVDSGARDGADQPEAGVAMFAPNPLWARDRTPRRGRSASDPAMDAGEAGPGLGEPVDAAYETQPATIGVETGAPPRRGTPAGMIVVGAAALAAIAAVSWYASRPHDRGIPELTPGVPAASQVAFTTAPPDAAPPAQANEPDARPPSVASDAGARRPTQPAARATPRVRPAEGRSATDAGVNASATTPPMIASPAADPMTVNPAPAMPRDLGAPVASPIAPAPATPPNDPAATP